MRLLNEYEKWKNCEMVFPICLLILRSKFHSSLSKPPGVGVVVIASTFYTEDQQCILRNVFLSRISISYQVYTLSFGYILPYFIPEWDKPALLANVLKLYQEIKHSFYQLFLYRGLTMPIAERLFLSCISISYRVSTLSFGYVLP